MYFPLTGFSCQISHIQILNGYRGLLATTPDRVAKGNENILKVFEEMGLSVYKYHSLGPALSKVQVCSLKKKEKEKKGRGTMDYL